MKLPKARIENNGKNCKFHIANFTYEFPITEYIKNREKEATISLAIVEPDFFLQTAPKLPEKTTKAESLKYWRKTFIEGGYKYVIASSVESYIPLLVINSQNKFTGRHQGRHRATILKEFGYKTYPIILKRLFK